MEKQKWTKNQIQVEVQRQTNQIEEVAEDRSSVRIGTPTRHETDELGRNWDIAVISNSTGYIDHIRRIIDSLRAKVELYD
jgi:hypothetical protein